MGTPCLSRPKEPSLSSPAAALLLLRSWCSPHSPALPSLASPTSNVDRAESVYCPGSAAKSRGDHESAPTRPCDKFCSKNDSVMLQHQWAQSQRMAQHQSFPKLLYVFFERNRRRGSPISLSSPLVSVVSPNRGRAREGFCSTCSSRLKTSCNPVKSKCACKIWQTKETSWVWAGNYAELQITRRKENIMCWWKKQTLTRHNGVKKLRPRHSTNRMIQTEQLVTCRVDGRDSRIGGKVV